MNDVIVILEQYTKSRLKSFLSVENPLNAQSLLKNWAQNPMTQWRKNKIKITNNDQLEFLTNQTNVWIWPVKTKRIFQSIWWTYQKGAHQDYSVTLIWYFWFYIISVILSRTNNKISVLCYLKLGCLKCLTSKILIVLIFGKK